MLTLYRRHQKARIVDGQRIEGCRHARDAYWKKCSCPMWVRGMLDGKPVKQSLKTRNWEQAQQTVNSWMVGAADKPEWITVAAALDAFLGECESTRRNLKEPTRKKYRALVKRLRDWCAHRHLKQLREIDVQALRAFTDSWRLGPRTQCKNVERIRSVWRFFDESGWLNGRNAARALRAASPDAKPVLPFTDEEISKILWLASSPSDPAFRGKRWHNQIEPRAPTFIKVLLLTGLRILDAAKLTKNQIPHGRVFLRTTKTGVAVSLPLPDDLRKELEAIPHHQLFQTPTGTQNPISTAEYWRVQLGKVFTAAKIDGHPHRFRHTMARRLLEAGASIEDVADILGNSPAIVRKHYSAFVQSRQDALDRRIRALWEARPQLVRVK